MMLSSAILFLVMSRVMPSVSGDFLLTSIEGGRDYLRDELGSIPPHLGVLSY